MARVTFAPHFRRYVSDLPETGTGSTVADVLYSVFDQAPSLRSYILNDQRHLRPHINIFVDDALADRSSVLGMPVNEDTHLYILQALSGG